MILSKKGLSDIVTNVLIILLVLVAIGIIWAFVRPAINQGSQQIQGQGECLTAQVSATACIYNASTQASGYNVTFYRDSGSADIQAIKAIFKDANGNSRVIEKTVTGFDQLESTMFSFGQASGELDNFDAATVDVAAVVRITSDPAGRTCDARGSVVTCP